MPTLNPLLRYSRAVDYLKKNNAQQAIVVKNKTNALRDGTRISLGRIFAKWKTRQDRDALRAYLLTLCAFGFVDRMPKAKTYFLTKDQTAIKSAIASFWPTRTNNMSQALKVKLTLAPPPRNMELFKYSRAEILSGRIKVGGNCYNGVAWWLYLGGLVSLRWFSEHLNMYCPAGEGIKPESYYNWSDEVWNEHKANEIGSGKILFFHRANGFVHYALSTEKGKCVAINTSNEICKEWIGSYPKPTKSYCTFRIADYLKTASKLDTGSHKDIRKRTYVKYAPWQPTNAC